MNIKNNKDLTIFMPSLGVGGAETVVVRLIKGFVKKGISINLILATNYGELKKEIPREVNIIELKAKRATYSLFQLIQYLRKNKPKKILCHLQRANRLVLMAKLLSGVNTEVYIVDHTTISTARKNYRLLERLVIYFSYKLLYPKATQIIHVSQGAARDLEIALRLNKGSVKVIYNPVVDEEEIKKRSEIPHPWLKNNGIPVILAVGRLSEPKGFDILIEAFKFINDSIDVRLIILGEGPLRRSLEEQIKRLKIVDRVYMPGVVNNVYDYMKDANVFVLSSRWEALPTALIEAMACGCPVVSTNCDNGPREILENGKYGRLVPVGDPLKLAYGIIDTLNQKYKNDEIVERALYFSVENSVNKYLEVMKIRNN